MPPKGAPVAVFSELRPSVETAKAWDSAWLYPSNIDAGAYCWELETSPDLVHWQVATNATWPIAPAYPGCATGWVTNKAIWPVQFWRLKGSPFQE